MVKRSLVSAAVLSAVVAGTVYAQAARDYISIVGSSTVYPFATVVAEQFGKATRFKTPKIESTGTGGGLKLFCEGVGVGTPDIANASRRIKESELEACAKNGVKDVVEVKIGYDGIVVANDKDAKPMELSRKDLFLALAKQVPDPSGGDTLVNNPYRTWKDVNPSLSDKPIEVLGPPPTSGTRDAFAELAREEGCSEFDFIEAMKKDEKRFKQVCHTMREDGAYVEAGENDNLIVQKLQANKDAMGIFGFSFLDQNTDRIQGAAVNGVQPSFETIAEGKYPLSRPLFIYVKKAHVDVIPGMKEYLAEFASDRASGEDGYLADKGLIPLPPEERQAEKSEVKNLTAMKMP